MRLVFADSVDTIDPDYDFVADRNGTGGMPAEAPNEGRGGRPRTGVRLTREQLEAAL
jgi:hypothetical protein